MRAARGRSHGRARGQKGTTSNRSAVQHQLGQRQAAQRVRAWPVGGACVAATGGCGRDERRHAGGHLQHNHPNAASPSSALRSQQRGRTVQGGAGSSCAGRAVQVGKHLLELAEHLACEGSGRKGKDASLAGRAAVAWGARTDATLQMQPLWQCSQPDGRSPRTYPPRPGGGCTAGCRRWWKTTSEWVGLPWWWPPDRCLAACRLHCCCCC